MILKLVPFNVGHLDLMDLKSSIEELPNLPGIINNPNFELYTIVDSNYWGYGIVGLFKYGYKIAEVMFLPSDSFFMNYRPVLRACRFWIEYCFKDLGYRRLVLNVSEKLENPARWAHFFGFKFEGVLRKYGYNGENYYSFSRVV